MHKLGSILIVLLFFTAYGRCVADGFGMLHASNASCCQEIIKTDVVNDCHEDDCHEEENSHEPEHPEEQSPTPCQLCFILSSDSMLPSGGDIDLPSPIFKEILPLLISCITLDFLTGNQFDLQSTDLVLSDFPELSDELRSRIQRIAIKATPVRGPSLA